MHSWSNVGTRCLVVDLLFLRFTKDCANGRAWGEAWVVLAVGSQAIQAISRVSSPVRAVTPAQRTAAQARATTPAAPDFPEPSGPRVSHLEPGLLISQRDLIEDPITSPHPHALQGPLYSTQLPPEPPSLARGEEEEARELRSVVASSPLMLSL